MYAPQTFGAALILLVISMICWGSWPNFMKALPKWRLEYFYLDFTIGFLLAALICGITMGSTSAPVVGFFSRTFHAGGREVMFALVSGFVWNLGNILLLISIMIAGIAVAYPVAAVPAIFLGMGISYWVQPIGSPLWLAGGALFLTIAAFANSAAYRRLGSQVEVAKTGGVGLALLAGILIGAYPPLVARAISGPTGLDSYTFTMIFVIGALVMTLIGVPVLLAHPLIGGEGRLSGYLQGKKSWHVLGILAGFIWSFGTVINFVSAKMVGVAISFGTGAGAPMIGALWGIFLWKEFARGSRSAKTRITVALTLYTIGVVGIALAYALR